MAKLKDIKGSAIQYLAEDPVEYVGTWASGGTLNNARSAGGGDGGTSTAAFATGNEPPSPTNYTTSHEQYDGTSWSPATATNTARAAGGAGGTTTAGFVATGRISTSSVTANTELWNGTSWTEVNNVNNARFSVGSGIGTQTAGLIAAGTTVPVLKDNTESWDGTNWTELGAYDGSASEGINLFGTSTAAIFAGGYTGSVPRGGTASRVSASYSWNGSSYTATTALPLARSSGGCVGTTTDGLVAGGQASPGSLASTLEWNGSTWTEVNDLSTPAQGWGSSKGGTTQDTIVFGGGDTSTEEWSFPPSTSTILQEGQLWFNSTSSVLKGYGKYAGISSATWSSGGSLNTARYNAAGNGTQTAGMLSGGHKTSADATEVEQYDGSSWTEITEINTGRQGLGASSGGSQTSTIVFGGQGPSPSYTGATEEWNGSAWTEVSDLNQVREMMGCAGVANAALAAGGLVPPYSATTETWDGTSWTEVSDLSTARLLGGTAGVQTSAILAGGQFPPNGSTTNVEKWDGSSWTEVAEINTGRRQMGTAGQSDGNDSLIFGGNVPANTAATESWNGTSWTEVNDLSTSRRVYNAGIGASVSAIAAGGYISTNPGTAVSEEWTADAAVSTVTTS